jgi:hypothetical protein
MGTGHRWRPAIQLTVTLPVALEPREVGAIVTTRILTVGQTGADTGEIRTHRSAGRSSTQTANRSPKPGSRLRRALETGS